MNELTLNIRHHDTKNGGLTSLYALCNDMSGAGFYSAGGDGNVVHWPNAPEDEGILIARTGAQIMTMVADPESNRLLIGTLDGHLIIIEPGLKISAERIKLMKGGIFGIKKTEIGYMIVGDNGSVSQIDFETYQIVRSLQISSGRSRSLVQDGDYFYAGNTEGRIYKIDGLRLKETAVSPIIHNSSVFSLIHPDDKLISAGKDGKIIQWNDRLEKTDEVQAHNTTINCLVELGESGLMASACRDGSIRIWNHSDLELLKVIDLYLHSGHLRSVNHLIWNEYHHMLISCSDDLKIKSWYIM